MRVSQKFMSSKGFTLVELLIVIAILGVLAAFAMVSYQKYVAKTQSESARVALLKQAQYMARVYNQEMSYKKVENATLPKLDNGKELDNLYVISLKDKQDDSFLIEAKATSRSKNAGQYVYVDQTGKVFFCKKDSSSDKAYKECPTSP